MARATQPPQQPHSIPEDPNTGPENRATQGRTPGKGEYPSAGYGTEQRRGGVPGAFGDEDREDGLPAGDEVTEETGRTPSQGLPSAA